MFYCPFWQVKVIIQQVLFLWWKSSKNRSHPQIECTHFSLVHRARHFENSSTHFPCIITVIILPRGHVCSVSRWLVSLQNSYIVIASAKTSGSIYLKVLISVRIVTKTTIGANFLGMKRTQKCEGKLEHCSCVCSRKWTYIGKRCENTEIQTNTRVWPSPLIYFFLWFVSKLDELIWHRWKKPTGDVPWKWFMVYSSLWLWFKQGWLTNIKLYSHVYWVFIWEI